MLHETAELSLVLKVPLLVAAQGILPVGVLRVFEGLKNSPVAQLELPLPFRDLGEVVVLVLGVVLDLQAVGLLVLGSGCPVGGQLLGRINDRLALAADGDVADVSVEVGRITINRVDPVQKVPVLLLHHLSNVVLVFGPVPVAAGELGVLVSGNRIGKRCNEVEIC